jgi:PAS domain S-box-containing protein
MATDKDKDASHLPSTVEERRREIPANPGQPRTHEEMLRLVHELQVHQIELEMQNEQLRQAGVDLDKALTRYFDLYDFAPVGYLTIDCDSSIRSVNLSGANLLGIDRSRLIGRQLRHFIADEDRLLFSEFITGIFADQGKGSCDVSLMREGTAPFFAHMEAASAPDGQECRITLSDITDRKRMEDRLIETENRFKNMFRNHAAVMLLIEPESGLIIDANKAAENFYGYTTKHLQTMKISDINTLSPELTVCEYQKALKEQRGYFIFKHSIACGEIRDVEVHSTPITISNSTVLFSIIHDITERKLAEDALQRSRDFLAETEKIGKVGGWEFDMDTLEQTWTEEVYRILEVDMDFRPTVEKGINFYTPSSRPILEKALQRAIEYGESFDLELELITAKSNLRSVHVICKTDLDNRRGFGFFQDITERKQAEEALKNSEERYHQLFEMESDTVLMVDCESNRILEANSAASRMYGYTREEFLQLTPADLSNEPSETKKYMHNEETKISLRWHRKKDGTKFPVEISGCYFVYQGRNVHAAAIRDITERVRAEQHLIDLNQRLRALGGRLQSVQEQERLAISRDMHDDVGQILTALKLDLGWLEQNMAPSETAVPLRLQEMHRNVDQITAVVQRIAANLRPPLLDNQGLSAAIEWHVGEFSKRSGIECFVMINEDADSLDKETATAIMRILQEGLTNIARHARASEAGISLCARDGNLVLEITDNGCGITPEQIASQDAYGLMGMQERAKLFNGKLEIKGEPGGGTILLLTIPLELGERTG